MTNHIKQKLSTINDMYCGKHLILNLQEYASAALNEWEKIESGDQKIGRKKKLLWNRSKNASASMLTVRTFCDLLGPDCDAQSGLTEEFKSIVAMCIELATQKGWRRYAFPRFISFILRYLSQTGRYSHVLWLI